MNKKKKLPKAIVPTREDTTGAGSTSDATTQDKTASAYPAGARELDGKLDATMATDDRRAIAMKMVERFSLWSGAAGLIPVPLVDATAVSAVQIQMVRRISQIYAVPFSDNRGKVFIASLIGSMIPASSGIGAWSLLKGVPLLGTGVSSFVMPVLSAGATYAIGMAFIQHFTSGGTLLDFKPRDYREFIKAQKEMWSSRAR
jgi:uncharacterized protein (DUF697 family)